MENQFSQNHLLKRLSWPTFIYSFFKILKMLIYYVLVCIISNRKFSVSLIFVPMIFLWLFSSILVCLFICLFFIHQGFEQFDYDGFWCSFLYIFCAWGLFSFLDMWIWFSSKLENFRTIISLALFWHYFSCLLSISFIGNSNYLYIR